jgi:hypothetical protein
VGELTQKQLDDKLRAPQKTLDQCAADLAAIEEQKARFLAAFSSEQEIELPPPPAHRKPAAAPAPPAAPPAPRSEPEPEPEATVLVANPLKGARTPAAPAPVAEEEPEATLLAPNPLLAAKAAAPPESDATMLTPNPLLEKAAGAPPPAIESDATFVVTAEQLAAMKQAAAEAEAAKAPAGDASDDRTFMLPAGWLVVNSDSPAPSEFRLGASNLLGRADDSAVVIARPGVSRKHAVIVADTSGFTIKDLESQNGTFVNGQRITAHALTDGDQIVIGDTKLVFKTPAGSRARS